jgi:hypothetical protein
MSAQSPTVFDLSAIEAVYHSQQRKANLGMNIVLGVLLLMGIVAFVYIAPALVRRWDRLASSTTGFETIALFFSAVAYELVVGGDGRVVEVLPHRTGLEGDLLRAGQPTQIGDQLGVGRPEGRLVDQLPQRVYGSGYDDVLVDVQSDEGLGSRGSL